MADFFFSTHELSPNYPRKNSLVLWQTINGKVLIRVFTLLLPDLNARSVTEEDKARRREL